MENDKDINTRLQIAKNKAKENYTEKINSNPRITSKIKGLVSIFCFSSKVYIG